MLYFDDILTYLIIGIVALIIPGLLTIWNIYNCFSRQPKKEKLISTLTVLVGGILYVMLYGLSFDTAGDWYEQVETVQYHYAISSDYEGILSIIILLGVMGYFTLLFKTADRLPPAVSIISISLVILLNVFQIACAVQLAKNIDGWELLLYVYHLNVLILSARVIQRHMRQQVVIFQGRKTESENNEKFMKFYKKVKNISNYTILVFIALFFIIAIIEIIFVISGQGLDAPVKVFTDTADWTFSKQIPPPPLEHEGHYLCTVAAGGHERIVKPLRYGTRRGTTIVVNRQLCIANAFEELIQLKFPKFHRIARYIYDTYGYPVSNLITSPLRADLIYIMMKPLEWIFLLVLYLLDLRPEQRIRNQYILQDEKYLRKRKTQVKKKRI